MIKKFLLVSAVVLVLFSFGIANAAQIDGLANAAGPSLPIWNNGTTADPLHVYANPGGLGQVLYYGYYNVRDGKVNYFQIVNTDQNTGVIAKVRFREGATIPNACGAPVGTTPGVDCGSLEVLDFVVCLSRGDVFTGAVRGDSGKAVLFQFDRATISGNSNNKDTTLTAPAIPASGKAFATQVTDTISIDPDLTREGYFEVLAYSEWDDTKGTCTGDATDKGIVRVVPQNSLMGVNYMNDEDTASANVYKALALADFTNTVHTPSLGNDDFTIVQGSDGLGTDSLGAVNYILTKSNLIGSYIIDPSLGAESEMVITFPTKRFAQQAGLHLFDNTLVSLAVWDINENTITPSVGFSPSFTPSNKLPNEVNLLNFFNSGNPASTAVFSSPELAGDVDASNNDVGDFDLGWIDVDLTLGAGALGTNCATNGAPNVSCSTYPSKLSGQGAGSVVRYSLGLPAISIMFTEFDGSRTSVTVPVSYKNAISAGNGFIVTP